MMEGEYISVKDLIIKLLDCDMDWEIEVQDKNKKKISKSYIVAVKPEGLVCLFG